MYINKNARTFREAASKFLEENTHKRTISLDSRIIKLLDPYIGNLPIEQVHMGTLQKYIEDRKAKGVKARTINHGLQMTRNILNKAANEWRDEEGKGWLYSAPKIKLLPEIDKRKPYPLSLEEQNNFFKYLPEHLREMALFAVNTGCRDQEICQLRWEWELYVSEVGVSVFIIPGKYVKNGQDRVVILNRIALEVISRQRQKHPGRVFTYKGKPLTRMLNNGWKKARTKAGLEHVRVHDLKHTFGHRLRIAGVLFEDRQDLLGHKSGRITTHYSAAEITQLIDAANKVCEIKNCSTLTLAKLIDQHRGATYGKFPEETCL
jgi:integrase